jgi:glucan phosphorylase
LEERVATMRILENVDLPSSFSSLLPVKPKISIKTHMEEEEITHKKPIAVMQMANLFVITSQKVNGVASIYK